MVFRALVTLSLLALTAAAPAPQTRERTIMLSGFDRIRVDGPFEVHVSSGSAKATVSGDMRAVDRIDVHQDGKTLIVSPSQNSWGGWPGDDKRPARTLIEVQAPSLRSASVTGSGRLAIDRIDGAEIMLSVSGAGIMAIRDLEVGRLNAVLTGSGTIAVKGKANKARFASNGSGQIDASGLLADDLTILSQSAGNSDFSARYTADVTNLGLGSVSVVGNPACKIRGPGPIRCGKEKRAN